MAIDLAQHNVIASFRDLELATDAIGRLREEGFEDGELSILGQAPEEVETAPEHETGEPLGGQIAKQTAAGSAVGGGVGAVLGAAGGLLVAAIPGVGLVAGVGALIGAVAGAGAGSTVGAIVEGESALRTDASWHQTFEGVKEGAVIVGVHTDDPERIRRAGEIMEELDPMGVRRVNDQGQEVSVED